MPDESSSPRLREFRSGDLEQTLAIYNHYVATSTVTFDEEPPTPAAWQAKVDHIREQRLPFIVAESESGRLLGYAYVTSWRPKAAYRYTGECSIYLAGDATGRGIGRALMGELLEGCRAAGLQQIVAVICDQGADASVTLHRSFGFREVGALTRVGYKFDRWLGTILMQKSLTDD